MSKIRDFFPLAYNATTQAEVDNLYDQWANTYDEELERNEYLTPKRCAKALKMFVTTDSPVLDYGCGTGLSGEALLNVGYSNIVGVDINSNMLLLAKKKDIYSKLYNWEEFIKFSLDGGTFPNICAVGVVSSGAGPASLLFDILNLLDAGGYFCFSYNDHTLSDDSYVSTLKEIKLSGIVKEVYQKHGDHLLKKNIGSTVYVLKKN